jgi:hypothetical protein
MAISGTGSTAESGGVVAGFFAFTEITEPSAHRAYNEWHQLDHLPEQLPIPGISHGQRWVSSPRCRAVSRWSCEDTVGYPDLSAAQYLTLYLMREPLDETLRLFFDLASRLHTEDRFFPYRRALESGPLPVAGTFAAPRVKISAAAVPYRPNRGIYAIVNAPLSEESGNGRRSDQRVSAAELVEIPGVAGVWFFGPATLRPDGRPDPEPASRGAGVPLDDDVTICFLDEDPVEAAESLVDLMRPRFDHRPPRFAGPLETVVPWSWDWFDEG